jgi:hypothetical protein
VFTLLDLVEWCEKKLSNLVDYLNSEELLAFSTWVGIHTSLVVFGFFAIAMIYLLFTARPPRPKMNLLWTWLIISVFFILLRVLLIRFYAEDATRWWGTLSWWSLTVSGILASVEYIREQVQNRTSDRLG